MNIKEIIRCKPDKEKFNNVRFKSLKFLVGFFALMLLCTVLSRAASSILVPIVTVQKPSGGNISHSISIDGTIEANKLSAIAARSDVRVKSIEVEEGAAVKEGDVLFTLDLSSLNELLSKEFLELQKLNLQLADLQKQAEKTYDKNLLTLERTQEDFDITLKQSEAKLTKAERAYSRAKTRYEAYRDDYDDIIDKWEYYNTVEDENKEIVSSYIAIKAEYTDSKRVYDDAVNEKENTIREMKRKLEDLQLDVAEGGDNSAENIDLKLKKIDITLKQMDIAKLQNVIKTEGKVISDINGIVSRVLVSIGKSTGSDASLLIAEKSAGYRFVGTSTKEQCKLLRRDGAVSISIPNSDRQFYQSTVSGIKNEENDIVKITAPMPENVGELGSTAVLKADIKSITYNVIVPVSAVRSDNSQKYVLVMDEIETALGKEQTARRVDVIVLENNETKAALSGSLSRDDQVITSSSKTIRAGDRVRLQMT